MPGNLPSRAGHDFWRTSEPSVALGVEGAGSERDAANQQQTRNNQQQETNDKKTAKKNSKQQNK
jgi:hypothetical protein